MVGRGFEQATISGYIDQNSCVNRQTNKKRVLKLFLLLKEPSDNKIMDSNMTSNLLSSKFRPIIEVQAHQGPETPNPIQYKNVSNHHKAQELATRFLFECGNLVFSDVLSNTWIILRFIL